MLANFRNYILSQRNAAGKSGLWVLYGLAVAITWLLNQLYELGCHVMKSGFCWAIRGPAIAILAKIVAALILLGYLAAQAGAEMLAANLITVSVIPLVILGFTVVVKKVL